jgi:chromosome partitioning protein
MKKRLDTQAISPRERKHLRVVSQGSSSAFAPNQDRVFAVGNVKGGVGKTTLAVNLTICEALHGSDVLLVDGDEQGTARSFTQLRADNLGAPGYPAVSLRGAEIRTQLRQLRNKYERVLIDVGGRDTASLRAALTVADVLVVPVLPATFDVWSLDPLQELIQEAREINTELRTIVVLNAADPLGKDNDEAAAIICEKEGFDYFPHPIVRRKVFRNAALPVFRFWSTVQRMKRLSMNSAVSRRIFLDMLAISLPYPMPITKHPSRKTKMNDKRAEKFIMAAAANETEEEGRFVQTPIRFPPGLLARIDRAAKKRGLNRSSWLRYAATKELDIEEL